MKTSNMNKETAENNIYKSVFGKKLAPIVEKHINAHFLSVCQKVTRMLKNKFSSSISEFEREDVATVAVLYALMYFLNTKGDVPADEKEWVALSVWKAKMCTLDYLRSHSYQDERLLVDSPVENKEGESFDESPIITRASWDEYCAAQREEDHLDNQKRVLRAFKCFLRDCCTPRSAAIYWARVMDSRTMDDVCESFQMTPGAVSVTVNRIGEKWKIEGRRYYDAA